MQGIEDEVLVYQLLVGDQEAFPPLELDRLPPPLPGGSARSIPGYELRDAVGPGSVGTLYRAFQPSVGREVLIEVIGRAESSELDFIRLFEADAQRLSLLDHQNIAPVIDYWRQPDGAFLVYRYPRGGFLHEADSVDARGVIDQVGSGLAYAHSFGMVHGSIRPDRVVLDEAGNASIIGFPIAGVTPRPSPEYPAYIAPETLTGASATAATDIYALSVLANELITGGSPDDGPVAPVHPAIERALSEMPEERQTSIAQFLIELNPADVESPEDRYTETRNPYKGLAAFQEKDAADFYGRASVVRHLIEALSGSDFVAVVGPSGIGKSSVVRAGLVPALRADALEGSGNWLIADFLPGAHPFLELQKALSSVAVDLPVEVTESLVAGSPSALETSTVCCRTDQGSWCWWISSKSCSP
jgi:serine/threonine protein kinase